MTLARSEAKPRRLRDPSSPAPAKRNVRRVLGDEGGVVERDFAGFDLLVRGDGRENFGAGGDPEGGVEVHRVRGVERARTACVLDEGLPGFVDGDEDYAGEAGGAFFDDAIEGGLYVFCGCGGEGHGWLVGWFGGRVELGRPVKKPKLGVGWGSG